VLAQIEAGEVKILESRTANALRVAMDDLARDVSERFNLEARIICGSCTGNEATYRVVFKVKHALPLAVIHRIVEIPA
jgi:hypothetical protein